MLDVQRIWADLDRAIDALKSAKDRVTDDSIMHVDAFRQDVNVAHALIVSVRDAVTDDA